MTQFLVSTLITDDGDVDFILDALSNDTPGVIEVEHLADNRLLLLVAALGQVEVARASGSNDRYVNALSYALNVACGLIPGMHER